MQPTKITRWLWHADKLFFGMVLVLCAVAVVSFWTSGTRRRAAPTAARAGFEVPRPPRVPWFDAVLPDPSVDIATDPHEYLPRPGEHACVNPKCTYIMPDSVTWCPACGARQDDRDGDGMDDAFEQRYEATNPDVADGHLDPDKDKFTNLEEYLGGSDPDDPDSIPAPVRLVAVGQELVDVLFRGFYQRANGERAIQLNWGNNTRTRILEFGTTFRGYTLIRVRERPVKSRHIAGYTATKYDLILKRPGGDELVLPRHKAVREPERYGIFAPVGTPTPKVRAYPGQTFKIEGHSYIVDEVSPQGAHLIGDRGEHHLLKLRPERPR